MAITGSANFMKYLLFIFNFFFVITGIIILSVGLTVQGVYNGYSHLLDDQFFSVPTFLIVIGSFIFIIAFFGCCGAYKENYCMVFTFSILLVFVFILELSAGISGYVLRNNTRDLVYNTLNTTMHQYNDKNHGDVTALWDLVQREFECCGLDKPQDWVTDTETNFIPLSCCSIPDGAVGNFTCTPDADTIRKTGCVQQFSDFIKAHAVSLGAVGITLAIIQFIGIFFACYISRQIKRDRAGLTGFP